MHSIRPLVAILLLVASAPATAVFHFMSIREVYVGPVADANAQYVMLQMYDAGQGRVDGHSLTFYDAAGGSLGTVTFTDDVPNDASQDYILVATNEAVTRFGVAADMVMTALLNPAGGKVCFSNVDCFSWGSYSGGSTMPSPSGTPFNAGGGGLTADTAVRRDISGGSSASQLDASDDTNDSAADFDFAAEPDPMNNGAPPPPGGGGNGDGYGGGGGSFSLTACLLLLLLRLRSALRFRTWQSPSIRSSAGTCRAA